MYLLIFSKRIALVSTYEHLPAALAPDIMKVTALTPSQFQKVQKAMQNLKGMFPDPKIWESIHGSRKWKDKKDLERSLVEYCLAL